MSFGPIYIDHIGIAAHGLDDNSDFWRLIGLVQGEQDETVADQGVTTRFFSTSTPDADAPVPKVELLEPTGDDTPIGRFLEKRGPGVQQVCFSVGDLSGLLTHLAARSIRHQVLCDLRDPPLAGAFRVHHIVGARRFLGGVLPSLASEGILHHPTHQTRACR